MSSDPLIIIPDKNKFLEYAGIRLRMKTVYYYFKLIRALYTSLYFYFFPLFICGLPIYKLIIIRQDDDPGKRGKDIIDSDSLIPNVIE